MPKRGGIQDKMNRFLAQYLPMLFQQRQREGYIDYSQQAYLDRFMKQMEAQEGFKVSASDRARVGNMLQNFFSTLGAETKELPYGSQQFAERAGTTAREFGLKPLPVDPGLGDKTQRYSQIAQQLMMAKVSGDEPPPEVIEEAVSLFGLDAVVSEVAKFNEAAAKKIDQEHRAQEIGIRRATAETGRLTALTAAGTAARKPAEEQQKQWLDFVTDIEDHLRQEGVQPDFTASQQSINKTLQSMSTAGKLPDPLSAETRGAVYTIIGGIRSRLIDGKLPTEGEKRFLAEARNAYKIRQPEEEGGGLVSPEVTDVELETREATIQAQMDLIREGTRLDPNPPDEATLRQLAIEVLKALK